MCLKESINGCKHERPSNPSTTFQSHFFVTLMSYDNMLLKDVVANISHVFLDFCTFLFIAFEL